MPINPKILNFAIIPVVMLALTAAFSSTAEETAFLDDDLEDRIAEVNEGELTFIADKPDKPVHQHFNQITITEEGLKNGWVKLNQCHENLDPISAIDIRFNPDKVHNLVITSTRNIDDVKVNGHIVELKGVKPNAKLCLEADSLALHRLNDSQLQLRNGPFMRQFLDGFYPLHVTVDVIYPSTIRLTTFAPDPTPTGQVKFSQNRITWSALFEGRLFTSFTFQQD